MAPDGDAAKNGNGNGTLALRRWTDKILCAFAVIILGLVGVVWASVRDEMEQFDCIQRGSVERIARLEQQQADIKENLHAIRGSQAEMQTLLNRIIIGMKIDK